MRNCISLIPVCPLEWTRRIWIQTVSLLSTYYSMSVCIQYEYKEYLSYPRCVHSRGHPVDTRDTVCNHTTQSLRLMGLHCNLWDTPFFWDAVQTWDVGQRTQSSTKHQNGDCHLNQCWIIIAILLNIGDPPQIKERLNNDTMWISQ